jgi:FkbM family methyltransferase
MGSIKVVEIQHLPKNDRVCYKETFLVSEQEGSEKTLYYYHSIFDKNFDIKNNFYAQRFASYVNTWARFIPKGSVAIDVGAYDGDTTLPIAYLCGDSGKTYAFECGEQFISKLNLNVYSNQCLNIEAVSAALMPYSGIHEFLYCPTDYNGGHHSTNSHIGTYTVPRLVRGVSFLDYFKDKDLSKLSFVKTDTEGHDFHILLSFKDDIKNLRPVICAEWFPGMNQFIIDLIEYIGYKAYSETTLLPIKISQEYWTQDILLIPSEKTEFYNLPQGL